MLAAQILHPSLKTGDGPRPRPGDSDWPRLCCLAYARAAAAACDLGVVLARRADRLNSVAPKLRAKGAGAVIAALLDDDALTAAGGAGRMSERAYAGCSIGWSASARPRTQRSRHFPSLWIIVMARRARADIALDVELDDLPPELRWREWMGRVEAVIFASAEPVTREVLARVVGRACNLDLLIDDIRDELRGRPYELVAVDGGWRHQTRKGFAEAIRAATGLADQVKELSRAEAGVLMAFAYFQPVTRGEISEMFGARSVGT